MRIVAVVIVVLGVLAASQARAQSSFTNFESGHVRPLALSPDGSRLFAVDTRTTGSRSTASPAAR
jgi:hypothetical protein